MLNTIGPIESLEFTKAVHCDTGPWWRAGAIGAERMKIGDEKGSKKYKNLP